MSLYLMFGLLLLVFFYHAYRESKRDKQLESVLNRLMSRDYGEYRYYQDVWEKQIKQAERERKKQVEEAQISSPKPLEEDLSAFEEDWEEEK